MNTFGDLKPIALLVGYVLKSNPRMAIYLPYRIIVNEMAARHTTENLGRYRVTVPIPQRLLDWRVHG